MGDILTYAVTGLIQDHKSLLDVSFILVSYLAYSLNVKMVVIRSSKTSTDFQRAKRRCYISEVTKFINKKSIYCVHVLKLEHDYGQNHHSPQPELPLVT
jgi:hypothetical protein